MTSLQPIKLEITDTVDENIVDQHGHDGLEETETPETVIKEEYLDSPEEIFEEMTIEYDQLITEQLDLKEEEIDHSFGSSVASQDELGSKKLTDTSHQCKICQKKYSRRQNLEIHMNNHHRGLPPAHKCILCEKSYLFKFSLNEHMNIHSGLKPHKCSNCDQTFSLKSALNFHVKPRCCRICREIFSCKGSLENHAKDAHYVENAHSVEKIHKCSICEKSYSFKHSLNAHMKSAHEEKSYKCKICEKMFSFKNVLKKHMMSVHGENLYKCRFCEDETFSLKVGLKKHMMSIHGVNLNYICRICEEPFSSKTILKNHLTSAHGENIKPLHKCSICVEENKTFSSSSHLNRHYKSKHRPMIGATSPVEKLHHKCCICQKTFSKIEIMKIHMSNIHLITDTTLAKEIEPHISNPGLQPPTILLLSSKLD